jgi:hypothetical protein
MRAELCRAHVELAQPDRRIGGIESHEAIVQEADGKAKSRASVRHRELTVRGFCGDLSKSATFVDEIPV